jgi:hypothetical protein
MDWIPLHFGMHEGKTLPQVLWKDPDWFFWAYDKARSNLPPEAELIYVRARAIKIPGNPEGELVAEYVVHPATGKFSSLRIRGADEPPHVGASDTWRLDRIDLAAPRKLKGFDKGGCQRLLRSVKFELFGDASYKMTKPRAEAFFLDEDNFAS